MCDVVCGSPEQEEMALQCLKGSLQTGWDDDYGGLRYMMDIEGKPLVDATVTADGKLWWPHTEALIALTMAYSRTRDVTWLEWLEKVHQYAYRTFVDVKISEATVHGEWFGYCHRDGTVARSSKGGNYKGFFHVPRALLVAIQVVEAIK
jgi:N-acylglucosamine 2-epimerase